MDTVDRIFFLLDKTDMEQQAFAAQVGVSDDTASNWRRRKSASYSKYLSKIAAVLNTSVEYLLTGEEKGPATVDGDGLTDQQRAMIQRIRQMDDAQLTALENLLDSIERLRGQ